MTRTSTFDVINPANGQLVRSYESHKPDTVEGILSDVAGTQRHWKRVDIAERARLMNRAADILRNRSETFARLMTVEMGKPIRQARSEVEKCAWVCDYYAEHAEGFLASETVETDASTSKIVYRPMGVVLAVMPWNFPFWQVFRFAAPNLMAGNAGLLKHAANVPGCALSIESIFREAGFPPHLFRTLLIPTGQVADVIAHSTVRAVTLTGSTSAGQAVAGQAGSVLKKTVLELGGSDPYLILEDADLDKAIPACVESRLINSGQSCIAAKRFIVVESLYENFTDRFIEEMKNRTLGDPLDEETDIGPQARFDLRDGLHRQVLESLTRGATLRLGGHIPEDPGAFYPPTVLADVEPGMPAADEELFGPVAAISKVKDEAEAIQRANDTAFGLGAVVFTEDEARGERIATEQLEAGSCFVNTYVKSDPRLPFGGIKQSGYGRELAEHGIREFVNIKTVYVG